MTSILFDVSLLRTRTRRTGIGRYVAELGLELERAASAAGDLEILALERIGAFGRSLTTRDVAGAVRGLVALPKEAHHYDWAYRVRLGLAATAWRVRPALVHSGHPNATPIGKLPCPRLVTCHDLIPLRFPEHYLTVHDGFAPGRRRLDFRRYHGADHVIAVSRATADDLQRLLGLPSSKLSVVYNGVDVERWRQQAGGEPGAMLARFAIAQGGYLIYAGGADHRKNAEGMFQALSIARRDRQARELVLAWAGPLRPPERERLVKLAAAFGVERAVRFLGYVSDAELAMLYGNALCQLFVSRAEGFGYPLIEAMATGCPCVTSNGSSLGEIAGDAAHTVDPERPEQIAQAILSLARDASERRQLGDRGRRRAAEFGLERCAKETLEVYRAVARA